MHSKSAGCFRNRWRITGTLTACTPLHVGSGDTRAMGDRRTESPIPTFAEGDTPQYSAFTRGVGDTILIPGSSLKGVVRSWLWRRRPHLTPDTAALLDTLFGYETHKIADGRGGKLEFHDAPRDTPAPDPSLPTHRWWDDRYGTALAPGVALDPHTRTARDRLLYYVEYAPEGTSFTVTLTGQNLEADECALLCAALDQGFNGDDDPIHLGANTANSWGRMRWVCTACTQIDVDDVKRWLTAAEPTVAEYNALFHAPAQALPSPPPLSRQTSLLRLGIRLQFEGAVLINDPSQEKRHTSEDDPLGHATVKRADGVYYLPGSSVRGALRAQARRIWQTLSWQKMGYLHRPLPPEISRADDVALLSPFYHLFGAPGWQSPVRVPDFELVDPPSSATAPIIGYITPIVLSNTDQRYHVQEFVAIDRFTGGGAEHKKFNARSLYGPCFAGVLEIDLARWQVQGATGWALLLLLYLLRDLQEGDVQFGWGRARGYGGCTATIEVALPGQAAPSFGQGDVPLPTLIDDVLAYRAGDYHVTLLKQWESELSERIKQQSPLENPGVA